MVEQSKEDEEKAVKLHFRRWSYMKDEDSGNPVWVHTKQGTALLQSEAQQFFEKAGSIMLKTIPSAFRPYEREFLASMGKNLGVKKDSLEDVDQAIEDGLDDDSFARKLSALAVEMQNGSTPGASEIKDFLTSRIDILRDVAYGFFLQRLMECHKMEMKACMSRAGGKPAAEWDTA